MFPFERLALAIGGKNGHTCGLSEPRNAQTLPVPCEKGNRNPASIYLLGDITASVLWVRQRMGSLSARSKASQPVVMPGTNAWQPSASSTSLPSRSV